MITNKEYGLQIIIADKSVIIPKGLIYSISINTQIVEIANGVDSMYPEYASSNTKFLKIEFTKKDTILFLKLIDLQTENTKIDFFGNEVCVIDTRHKDELEIKLL